MTTRLIEECFDLEEIEENFKRTLYWIADSYLCNIKDLENPQPGKVIKLKRNPSMKIIHALNYGGN